MQNKEFLRNRDYKTYCEFLGVCFGAKLTLFLKNILNTPIILKLHRRHKSLMFVTNYRCGPDYRG